MMQRLLPLPVVTMIRRGALDSSLWSDMRTAVLRNASETPASGSAPFRSAFLLVVLSSYVFQTGAEVCKACNLYGQALVDAQLRLNLPVPAAPMSLLSLF